MQLNETQALNEIIEEREQIIAETAQLDQLKANQEAEQIAKRKRE